ncbi:MAG: LD-carboxypeptidase [Chlorobium phaeobacteroides]|jgi:muramoyltetrapeptide carboxypeptidase|nr:LD-carboxypeptidase [Chlorobium phaeobacteroides]MBV5319843.1 LD-carboxypeptidase [Chlorobium phaeobacteroides]
MKTLLPKALRKGDTIGLISPSSHSAFPERIARAILYLEERSFKVKPSTYLNCIDVNPAIADQQKLSDLHAMFEDTEVDAVICLRGGAGATRLLKNIDYALIEANPKILIGYSDITALSLAILAYTGLVSFSGPMIATELYEPTPYTEEHFWGMLTDPRYALSLKNHSQHRVTCLKPGDASGNLIGGNLSVLCSLIGTPYLPILDDAILFLEDVNEPAYRIDRMLSHLLNAGLLSRCRAILFGQFTGTPEKAGEDTRLEHIFDYYATQAHIEGPVMTGLSYGHIADLMTLPLGAPFQVTVRPRYFSLEARYPVIHA